MTLEELKAQRAEINRQIKALEEKAKEHGRVKTSIHNRPAEGDIINLSIRDSYDWMPKEKWHGICGSRNKERVKKYISELINDLEVVREGL